MPHPKIVVAGIGSIGRRHLHNLQALGCHDVVLYRTGRSTLADADLQSLPTETSLEAVFAHQPDAVVVANPTALHLPVALAAAQANCHLFLEKPVSHSLDGLDQLQAEARHLQVLVGFQFRFHPGLEAVRQLLQDGAIGRVICAQVHWGEYLPGWHPWEDYRQGYSARSDLGGGVLLTLCHPFDYLRWLLGEVQTVSATVGQLSQLDLDVEDVADVTLQFESGAIATVHLDYVQRPPNHGLQIIGQAGTIRWNNADGAVQCYRAEADAWTTIPAAAEFERNTLFMDEMRHFLDCIAGSCPPRVTLQDGVQALAIALAAKQSASEGRRIDLHRA